MNTAVHTRSEISIYLDDLVSAARDVLGGNLIGAYAGGSVAFGAYQPGRSDVDVALVTAEPLSRPVKEALANRLRHESLSCPARGVELVVYWRAVARSGTPEPGFELELNSGAEMAYRATFGGTERQPADGLFWYGIDRSILREHGLALVGPPAEEVFGEVVRSDLRQLLVLSLEWSLAQSTPPDDSPSPGSEDAILGACRALVRFRYGHWLAKIPAGNRIATSGLSPSLIRRAIAARDGGVAPGADETRAFQRRVLAEISGHQG